MRDLMEETSKLIIGSDYELLTEMAYPPSKVYTTIDSRAQGELLTHLILCFVYGRTKKYNKTIHHWASEISGILHKIWKLSTTNKYPTYDNLMKKCYYTWSDCLDEWIPSELNNVVNEYGAIPEYDIEDVKRRIYDYYSWLYKKLSANGVVDANEIIGKVQDLSK